MKTALVLSAGGMFGAYQAGAWLALSEWFKPDMVVGASVGALNGWLIAGGCDPALPAARWREPSVAQMLQLRHDRGFRRGWFDPEPLREQARSLYRSYTPQVPYGLVVVKLSGLEAQLVQYPYVTAEHLQATVSIPICLPPVRIGGERYLDGGLIERLPVWAAVEMGATRIIAVDCLRLRNGWIRAGVDAFRKLRRHRKLPSGLDLRVIAPAEPMGNYSDAIFWKRENVERWIEWGARDARRLREVSWRVPATSFDPLQ